MRCVPMFDSSSLLQIGGKKKEPGTLFQQKSRKQREGRSTSANFSQRAETEFHYGGFQTFLIKINLQLLLTRQTFLMYMNLLFVE